MPSNQQTAVYAAQRVIDPLAEQLADVAEVQAWVNDLRETWWWWSRYSDLLYVEVQPLLKQDDYAHAAVGGFDREAGIGRMDVGSFGRNTRTVVHELAHVVVDMRHRSRVHDPLFARTYGELVYYVFGSDAWQTLAASFERHGVDYMA